MTTMKLVFSDAREVDLGECLDQIKVRGKNWDFDFAAMADVSLANIVWYGAQRIVNDAAGQGSDVEQQAKAQKKYDALVKGEARVQTREDSLMAIAIAKAIEHEVKADFKAKSKKLEPKLMRVAARALIDKKPAYLALAQIELDRRVREREEEKAFLAKAGLDTSALADLVPTE